MTKENRKIMLVLEAMNHQFIMDSMPKNIMKYFKDDIHPSVTWGLGSRPSAAAYLGGMLPVCSIPQCHHRQIGINWCNPFFLSLMKEFTQEQFYLTSNGWTLELMLPWMNDEQIRKNFEWVSMRKTTYPSADMIDYFLEKREGLDSYYAYIHLFETHYRRHLQSFGSAAGSYLSEKVRIN